MSQGSLLVCAVGASGQREIIGVYQANTESETSWTEVFRDPARRGLSGVRLVVSDDHEGLVAAIRRCFQGVLWQRCQKHYQDNVLALVSRKDRERLRQALRTVFDAASREHAARRLAEVVAEWRERYPAVRSQVTAIAGASNKVLRTYAVPTGWHALACNTEQNRIYVANQDGYENIGNQRRRSMTAAGRDAGSRRFAVAGPQFDITVREA